MMKFHKPDEIVITAAIVGAEITREQTPYLPITAEEIGQEAKRCVDAGASVIHLHVRDDSGKPTQSQFFFQQAIDAIRSKTDTLVQVSTGGAVGMSTTERLEPLECHPEMATLNCGTLNFGDDIFVNSWPMIQEFANKIRKAGCVPELELYDSAHIDTAQRLLANKQIDSPFHVQFVLGVPGGAGARETVLRFLVSELAPENCTWSVAAVGRHQKPMTELAVEMGGFVRVGLEDNIYIEKGTLSKGSAPLVDRISKYAVKRGRCPVPAHRAAEILGIKTANATKLAV